jgi:hypothetical protein
MINNRKLQIALRSRSGQANRKKNKGVASLAMILLLGGIIIQIALVGATLGYLLTSTNLSIRLSAEALAAAQGGIDEGIMRVMRKDYPANPPTDLYSYALPATGNAGATITLCKNFTGATSSGTCGATPAPGKYEILSIGQSLTKSRKLVAVFEADPGTLLIKIQSITEVKL